MGLIRLIGGGAAEEEARGERVGGVVEGWIGIDAFVADRGEARDGIGIFGIDDYEIGKIQEDIFDVETMHLFGRAVLMGPIFGAGK